MILSLFRDTDKNRAALKMLPIKKVKNAIHKRGPSTNKKKSTAFYLSFLN
jgi:hypothetical protein